MSFQFLSLNLTKNILTLKRPRYTFMSAIHRGRLHSAIARFSAFSASNSGPGNIHRWQGVYGVPKRLKTARRKARRYNHFYPLQGKLPVPKEHCFAAKVFSTWCPIRASKGEDRLFGAAARSYIYQTTVPRAPKQCQSDRSGRRFNSCVLI